MCPASVRSPHTRSSARLAPMFPGFGMHRRSRLGSDYVRSGRSVVGRSSIRRVVASSYRVALALRLGAYSLHHANNYLGEFFRRITRKLGKAQAIIATAHKLARIVFHLLSTKQPYDESVFQTCEQDALQRAELRLRRHAERLGFQLVPATSN